MTEQNGTDPTSSSVVLTPELQQAVRFLGALVRVRAGGDATAGGLAILEHHGERGYSSPVHRHLADEETFLVLDGEVRVEVGGQARTAGAGAAAILPRQLPHAFVVTSSQAPVPHRAHAGGLRQVHAGRRNSGRCYRDRTAARRGAAGSGCSCRTGPFVPHRDRRSASRAITTP